MENTNTTKNCTTGRCKNRTTTTKNANGICDRHPRKATSMTNFMEAYSVTIDIPYGISKGTTFDNINDASDAFGEASRGSYPAGTIVALWDSMDVRLDIHIVQ